MASIYNQRKAAIYEIPNFKTTRQISTMKHLRLIYFNAPEECEISPLEVHVSVGRVLQGAKTVFR